VRRHEGKEQKVKTTSSLVKVVLKLKDKQWEKIMEAAARTSKQKRETISAMVPQATAASSESDFELADDDEDIVEG
jgi:hypothetical protein